MSVLIKGMKMPKGDKALVVVINSNGTVDRPNWRWDCTLIKGAEAVELPDHGDLIDRDALREKAHKLPNGYNHGYFHKCVDELFDYAPVVIPAERSEDATH